LGFQVAFALLFWLPVFYQVQKTLGLTDHEIFGIQSAYYLLFCLFELPTGWLADRLGAVRTLRAGALTLILAHVVIVLHPGVMSTYAAFWVHFALIALSRSLVSGASNAYLFEAYADAGRSADYVHVEGRARAYGLFAKIVCWAGVGFVTEKSLLSSYWLTLGSAVAATGYAFMLRERPTASVRRPRVTEAAAALLREPRVMGLMVQGMGVFVLARIVQVNLFQPLLLARGFSTASLGWVMAIMTGAEALASLKLSPVLKRFKPERSVSLLSAAVAATVVGLALPSMGLSVALLVLFSAALGFAGPIQRQVINSGISASSGASGLRATLLSLESLLDRAVCSAVVALMGPWVQASRLDLVLLVSGVAFFGIAAFQLWANRGKE